MTMESTGTSANRCVLVVEDDIETRGALVELLGGAGYVVREAANGRDALMQLRSGPCRPDVIVLDLHMPVMDGWEFRVRQRRDPDLAELPVVVLSGDESPKAAAIESEFYVRKPVARHELLQALSAQLDRADRLRSDAWLAHLERMTSIGTLASGVAHEINNPLTYVLVNLRRLRQTVDAERAKEAALLDDAIEGAERIRSIVADLASFSRPDRATHKILDVVRVVEAAIALVASDAQNRATLDKDYVRVAPVLGNEGRLGQVFLNLLVNAIQAIPPGEPDKNRIRVSTRQEGNHLVVIEVSDTGSGIPESIVPRIFEPFFTTKPVGTGTGLGLSICHGIVHAHGGTVEVESRPDEGTTFRVKLPTAEVALSARTVRSHVDRGLA